MSLLDVFADWLSESATIQRGEAPVAVDATGSGRVAYSDVATAVPCQLQISQGSFVRALYGDNPTRTGILFVRPEVDLRVADRVLVKGLTWLVESIEDLRDSGLDHLEAQVSLLPPPND